MKILMLVNWKIEYSDTVPKDKQPPDYYVPWQPYWFFRYFKNKDISVDVADISSFPKLEEIEKNRIRFYIGQAIKQIPHLDEYDVVLSHGMQSGIVIALWRKLFGKGSYKHIVFDIGAFNSARESGASLKFMRFAGRSIDGIIYHTPSQIDYYRKCHPWLVKKAIYIPFGTDTEFFDATAAADARPDTAEAESETTAQADSRPVTADADTKSYILCAGYNKRDWKTFMEAHLKAGKPITLRFLGTRDLVRLIMDRYRDYDNESEGHCLNKLNIEILDGVSVTEFIRQVENAAFCVLPLKSVNYSYGQMTMLQQMALGKAVVAADVPSLQPYFREGANIKYEPENVDELAGIIKDLSTNSRKCEDIGRKAADLVRSEFNERIMAEKIEKAIDFLEKI